ncbi:hypothetical protein ACQ3G7_08730 [Kosakonia oryzendophytica]|uniref:hypothetical protein n=1 Tax=Kosakonia oryzendophytica TaxID=1005665 RepID=UPI003D345E92
MSTREEILDPSKYWSESGIKKGLLYSEVLGWLDMGHARGNDIKKLMDSFAIGEASGNDYYDVRYEQTMAIDRFSTGRFKMWRIKRGRNIEERRSIALSMMMSTAVAFENWQSMPWFSWYTDSGFSAEDLVSDLFGFYKFMFPRIYWHDLRIASKESALRRWDYYGPIGSHKNKGFLPLLFPDPGDKFTCQRAPFKGQLPKFMTMVTPYKSAPDDVIARPLNKIAGILTAIE